jgi:hypothetical protein
MERKYRQGEILRGLYISKIRLEYLVAKLLIRPSEASTGTGVPNYWTFEGVYKIALGDVLTKWGFSAERVRSIFKFLESRYPELLEPEAPFLPENVFDHLIFASSPDESPEARKKAPEVVSDFYGTMAQFQGGESVLNPFPGLFMDRAVCFFVDFTQIKVKALGV